MINQDKKSEKIETHNGIWDFIKVGMTTASIVLFNLDEKKQVNNINNINNIINTWLYTYLLII